MKIRSFLIVSCIVVVPLIAMFSHRLPPGTRAAVGSFLRDLVGQPAGASRALPPQAVQPVAPVPLESTPSGAPEAAGPRVVKVAASVPEANALGRLRALGAVEIDCQPLPGNGGHVASCRLPVDGAGQLERVFRATGADASTAADNLLRDVTAWRRGTVEPRPHTMRF